MGALRRRGGTDHSVDTPRSAPSDSSSTHTTTKSRGRVTGCLFGCCKGCAKLLVLIAVLSAVALVVDAVSKGRPLDVKGVLQPFGFVNFFFMKLARDLSRVKARKRRFGQKDALMPVLFGREEPLPLGDPDAGIALTADELVEYDGRELPGTNGHAPLFLAVRGRIYDVTAGAPFYGPGRSYHKLVGKDATRAFCTGCLEPECLISSVDGLTEAQQKEADRWIELYEHHDKYKLVGRVRLAVDLTSEDEQEQAEDAAEEVERAREAESRKNYKPFKLR